MLKKKLLSYFYYNLALLTVNNFNMKSISFFSGVMMFLSVISPAQTKIDSLKKGLEKYVTATDLKFENQIVSDEAYNIFQQKKTSYYLTGASEVSLSKVYATYSSEQDKFNFGVNFKVGYREKDPEKADRSKNQLNWLLTPLVETNIKKSFSTLYEKGKWNSDIRIGGKINYFLKANSIIQEWILPTLIKPEIQSIATKKQILLLYVI